MQQLNALPSNSKKEDFKKSWTNSKYTSIQDVDTGQCEEG